MAPSAEVEGESEGGGSDPQNTAWELLPLFTQSKHVGWVTDKHRAVSSGKEAAGDISQTFLFLILLVIAIYLSQARLDTEHCPLMQTGDLSAHLICKCYNGVYLIERCIV